ncbi:ABC transporter permease [Actinomyces ruminicola]|uniref:ABC transporter permease n=1 Tax=Actinomyces ruminicola TaxID=332524 RepID=UPI0011C71463|nr:ABC transporter permease [Actinomyces ruminicola]
MSNQKRSASELRQFLVVTRLEMTSYFRSPVGLLFGLAMPSALLYVAVTFWYPEQVRTFAVPDMAFLSVVTSGLYSIGVAITEQRGNGVLKTYLSSPLRTRTYLAAQVADRVVVVLVGNSVMVLVGTLGMGIPLQGELWRYALVLTTSLATMLSFGFLLASRFRSVETAGMVSSLLFFAIMFGSGIFSGLATMPGWIANILDVLPFRPIVEIMRRSWIDPGFSGWAQLGLVFTWFLVFWIAASVLFRWTPNDR